MPNRRRDKQIVLRFTDSEFEYIQKQFLASKEKNRSNFFLTLLRKHKIVVYNDITEALTELKIQGNILKELSKNTSEENDDLLKPTLAACYALYKKWIDLYLK